MIGWVHWLNLLVYLVGWVAGCVGSIGWLVKLFRHWLGLLVGCLDGFVGWVCCLSCLDELIGLARLAGMLMGWDV